MLRRLGVACLHRSYLITSVAGTGLPSTLGASEFKWSKHINEQAISSCWQLIESSSAARLLYSTTSRGRNQKTTASDPEQRQQGAAGVSAEVHAPAGTARQLTVEPDAAVLVRDSSGLKARLLQPPAQQPAKPKQPRARGRRKMVVGLEPSNGNGQQAAADAELKYFTEDGELQYFSAEDAAEDSIMQRRIKVERLSHAEVASGSLTESSAGEAGIEDAAGTAHAREAGDSSAALLEMQQLQELHLRRGGTLAPEDLEVVQAATQRAAKKLLPMEMLASAIMNALDVGKKYGVDPKVLLTPRIAQMKTELLEARAAQIKRMLPDTQLHEELLARGAEDVSGQITRIIAAFHKQLGMGAPAQMLTQPGTCAKALRLPVNQLEEHLRALQNIVGSKLRARELASSCTDTIFSSSFPALLDRVDRVAAALQLTQDEAVELVLRYPFLARTNQQLLHMEQMVATAPSALRLSQEQLLPCFIKYPDLFRYSGSNELAQKYLGLAGVLHVSVNGRQLQDEQHPLGPSDVDLLAICASSKVRRAGSVTPLIESLRTSAAILGYSSPAQLLPMLLQPPKKCNKRGHVYGSGKRRLLSTLLKPPEVLAARAAFTQQQRGLTRTQVSQLARRFPHSFLDQDIKTQKLKHALLQGQLLGSEIVTDNQLDPRMSAVLKKCPLVSNLAVHTALQRIQKLESTLQLQPGEARQLVLRAPQLLVYNPAVLGEQMESLTRLMDDNFQAARSLVLQEPKVLVLMRQYQSGSLTAKLSSLHSMLSQADTAPDPHPAPGSGMPAIDAESAAAAAAAAVRSAAARAGSHGSNHGVKGVRQKPSGKWECRSYLPYGKSKQYITHHPTALEAACAQDLLRLALRGPGSAANLPEPVYTATEVEAVSAHLGHLRRQWQTTQHQQQQQNMSSTADQCPKRQEEDQPLEQTVEVLLTKCLATKAGRQLLSMAPVTAHARLQCLAGLLGLSVKQLLSKALTRDTYLQGVLSVSPTRMEAAAFDLQQQLDLALPQLQRLLRSMPALLLYKQELLRAKVAALYDAFASCCVAVQQTAVAAGSEVASSISGQGDASADRNSQQVQRSQQQGKQFAALDAVSCLQRAVLCAPQLLGLKAGRVAWRLHVLQDVCSSSSQAPLQLLHGEAQQGSLYQQLQDGLRSGAIGRWLTSGDASYLALLRMKRASEGHSPSSSTTQSNNSAVAYSSKPLMEDHSNECMAGFSLQQLMRQAPKTSGHYKAGYLL